MNRRFSFAVLGIALLFSMAASAQGADKKKQPVPGADNASRLVGTRSSDGDQTTVRDAAGRTTGSATTNGNRTTLRNSSGRAIGSATTNGNNVTFRDSAGRTTGSAAVTGNRTTYRDSSGRAIGSSSGTGKHTPFRDSSGRSTGSATESGCVPPFETAAAGPTQRPIRRPARQAVATERRSSCTSGSFASCRLISHTNVRLPHPADAGSRFLTGGTSSGARPAATKARRQLRKLFLAALARARLFRYAICR